MANIKKAHNNRFLFTILFSFLSLGLSFTPSTTLAKAPSCKAIFNPEAALKADLEKRATLFAEALEETTDDGSDYYHNNFTNKVSNP
ncbi:MAG: hypothetical protein AAF203_11445, partial [Pseudomonadota bacterium]